MDLWRTCASGWVRRAGRQALRSFAMDLLRGRIPGNGREKFGRWWWMRRGRRWWRRQRAAARTAVVAEAKGCGADPNYSSRARLLPAAAAALDPGERARDWVGLYGRWRRSTQRWATPEIGDRRWGIGEGRSGMLTYRLQIAMMCTAG